MKSWIEHDRVHIKFRNNEEYLDFLKCLEELGYNWRSGSKPTAIPYYYELYNKRSQPYFLHIDNNIKIISNDWDAKDYFYVDELPDIEPIMKERNQKREELRLTHLDEDPYGEEEWLDESKFNDEKSWLSESFNGFNYIRVKVDSKDEYHTLGDFLESKGVRWVNGGEKMNQWFPSWYMNNAFGGYICLHDDARGRRISQNQPEAKKYAESDGAIILSVQEFIENYDYLEEYIKNKSDEEVRKKIEAKEEARLKHIEIDPYGEDEWLDESVDESDFIGILDCYPHLQTNIKNFLDNHEHNQPEANISLKEAIFGVVKNKRIIVKGHSSIIVTSCSSGYPNIILIEYHKSYSKVVFNSFDFCKDPNDIIKIDMRSQEEIEKEKERIRLKYIDIDPYGEDIWESKLNEKIKFKETESIVVNRVENRVREMDILSVDPNDLDKLNKDFLGWVHIPSLGQYIMHVTKWKENIGLFSISYDKYVFSGELHGSPGDYTISLNTINIIKYEELEPVRRYTEDDPYGEEEWENEGISWWKNGEMSEEEFDETAHKDFEYLRKKLKDIRNKKMDYINDQDYSKAADLRDEERKIEKLIKELEKCNLENYDGFVNENNSDFIEINFMDLCDVFGSPYEAIDYLVKHKKDVTYKVGNDYVSFYRLNHYTIYDDFNELPGDSAAMDTDQFCFSYGFLRKQNRNKLVFKIKNVKGELKDHAEEYRKKKEEIIARHVDIDPYGEEDWEEIKESSEGYDIISIKDLINKHSGYTEFMDELKQLIGDKVITIYEFHIEQKRYQEYKTLKINSIFSTGEKEWADIKNKNFGKICDLNKIGEEFLFKNDKVVIHTGEIERRITEEDPYGEENWEDDDLSTKVNENLDVSDFKVGDKYRFSYPNTLRQYVVEVTSITYSPEGEKIIGLTFGDGSGSYFKEHVFKEYPYNTLRKVKRVITTEDPYGEEDWGDEGMNESNKFKNIRQYAIFYDNKDEMIEIAEKLYDIGERTYRSIAVLRNSRKTRDFFYYNQGDQAWCRGEDENRIRGLKEMTYGEFMGKTTKKKYTKIENKELDPYDEEDWGWDVKENVSLDVPDALNKTILSLKTQEEYDSAMSKLDELGYFWGEKTKASGINYWPSYKNDFALIFMGNKYLAYATIPWCKNHDSFRNYKYIKIEDLLKIKIKKYKKVNNLELDPYGEDDWGYEEIKESVLIGLTVRMRDDSVYKNQAYVRGGDGVGKIIQFKEYADDDVVYTYRIRWNNGEENFYRKCDVILEDKIKKVERPDIDPYGEDDWGYEMVKESSENEIIIDIKEEILKYDNIDELVEHLRSLIEGKQICIYELTNNYGKWKYHIYRKNIIPSSVIKSREHSYDTIKKLANDFKGISIPTKALIIFYYDGDVGIFITDKIVLKKERERIYNDIDPYGEEDWNDDEKVDAFLNEKLVITDKKITGNEIIIKGIPALDDFIGWVHISQYPDHNIHAKGYYFATNRSDELYITYDKYQYIRDKGIRAEDTDEDLDCLLKEDFFIKKVDEIEPKRIYSQEDPYGEEDWDEELT